MSKYIKKLRRLFREKQMKRILRKAIKSCRNDINLYWHFWDDCLLYSRHRQREDIWLLNRPANEIEARLSRLRKVKDVDSILRWVAKLPYDKQYLVCHALHIYPNVNIGLSELRMAHQIIADSPTIKKLHEKECPNCPWNGKTLFP